MEEGRAKARARAASVWEGEDGRRRAACLKQIRKGGGGRVCLPPDKRKIEEFFSSIVRHWTKEKKTL